MYMGIGQAIEAAKGGRRIARKGWNGKDMYVYYVPAASYPPTTQSAKDEFGGAPVPYREYLAMKTSADDIATWAPSCSDTLADDWYIV
jgi:hypothetical protein